MSERRAEKFYDRSGMPEKKRIQERKRTRDDGDRRRMEAAIKNNAARLCEELNFRLVCEFCGTGRMGEDEREAVLEFAKAGGNFPLWREYNLPGNVLQVESIDVVGIVWPAAEIAGKKKWGKIRNSLSAFLRLLFGKLFFGKREKSGRQ